MREEMPIGFGFALAENEKAMSSFAKMTEEEKNQYRPRVGCGVWWKTLEN